MPGKVAEAWIGFEREKEEDIGLSVGPFLSQIHPIMSSFPHNYSLLIAPIATITAKH